MQRQNDVEDVSDGTIEDIEVYVAFVVDVAGSTRQSSAFLVDIFAPVRNKGAVLRNSISR